MKKLFSASIMMMITAAAFAQDTIPKTPTTSPSLIDTVPVNRSQKDSADWNEKMRAKYDTTADVNRTRSSNDSMQANWPADAKMDKDSAAMSERQTTDTLSAMNNNTDSLSTSVNTNQDANATPANTDSAAKENLTDRIIMRDGAMFVIKNGESTPLDKEYTLESGTVVSVDGTVKYVSGKTATLKDGQFIEIAPGDGNDKADKKKMKKAIKAEKKKKKAEEKSA